MLMVAFVHAPRWEVCECPWMFPKEHSKTLALKSFWSSASSVPHCCDTKVSWVNVCRIWPWISFPVIIYEDSVLFAAGMMFSSVSASQPHKNLLLRLWKCESLHLQQNECHLFCLYGSTSTSLPWNNDDPETFYWNLLSPWEACFIG